MQSSVGHVSQPNETSPLLSITNSDRLHEQQIATGGTPASALLAPQRQTQLKIYIVGIITLAVFLIDFGGYLLISPQTEIFESIICHDNYADERFQTPIGNRWHRVEPQYDCTTNAVQAELAFVTQLANTFTKVPGILLAVPYGILADRVGRKPVLVMSLSGLVVCESLNMFFCWFPQIFPIRLVWLTPLALMVGGGPQVASSLLFTMVADILDAKHRANAFFIVATGDLIAEATASPLAATLMMKSPWLPALIALGLIALSPLIVFFFLPETMPAKCDPLETDTEETEPGPRTLFDQVRKLPHSLKSSMVFLFQNSNLLLLIFLFFVSAFVITSEAFQLQYVRKFFGWSYSRATYLTSTLRSIINIVLFLALLPLLGMFLTNTLHLSPASKDLALTRTSAIILVLGTLAFAFSSTTLQITLSVVFGALGNGMSIQARSLITSLVSPTHIGMLFTAIAVASSAGGVAAGPVIALTFEQGMKLGATWAGLPYIVVAGLLGVAVVALALVRLGRGTEERVTDEVVDLPVG